MNKDPAFLFYSSDFLTGVADLTMEERGQYITLMCLQHQKGHLSEKTIRLTLGLSSVSEIPDVLRKFTVDENGCYYNKRLEKEIEIRDSFIESRKINGSMGGRPKKEGISRIPSENLVLTTSEASEKLIENENEDVNDIDLKEIDRGSGGKKGEPLFDMFWAAYPKKKSKGDAEKAWKTIKPDKELVAIMLKKLAQAKTCREWINDGGQFIPYPATWLRGKGWEDEIVPLIDNIPAPKSPLNTGYTNVADLIEQGVI